MKKQMYYYLALLLLTFSQMSFADLYSWEDSAVGADGAMGTYGNVESAVVTDEEYYGGAKALKITENPVGGTPQSYVAWITGVSEGDTVTASMWIKGNGTAKGRIWGHYSSATDIDAYDSAHSGNNNDYAGEGEVWQQITNTWTIDAGKVALVIEARIYSNSGEGNNIMYVDDVEVSCSNPSAVLSFPGNGTAPDITVPDVSDLSRTAAEQAIANLGLVPVFADVYSDTVPVGAFISQDPIAGNLVNSNSVVTLYYSIGQADEFNSMQYGWEDGENPYLAISDLEASFDSGTYVEKTQSVKMTKTGTGRGDLDVAKIAGLNVGDLVTAVVKLQYHGTNTIGVRLWGDGDGPGSNEGYTSTEWGTQSFTWTATGSTIDMQLRCYGDVGEYAYADDLRITAPGYASITFPGTGTEIEPEIPDGGFIEWTEPDDVYGWENSGLNVGQDGDVECKSDTTEFYTGTKSLKITRGDNGGSQAYLARITGLVDGDVVRARMMAKKGDSAGEGIRLWGHYETNGEYAGSAGGYDTYCGQDWTTLGKEWTFDDGAENDRNSLVVDARVYGTEGFGWVDDLELWVPEGVTITFPEEPNDPICYLENDLTGDCVVNLADFSALADSWMEDGFGVPDPNADDMFYKFYTYGWDDGKTAMETYPSAGWDDPNQIPTVENIVDPDNPSNKILKITSGTWYNAKIVLARIDRLQDADQIYVAVKWKDDFVDAAPSLQLAIEHHTNGNYAGGAYTRPIYSDIDWGYGASLFTFDVGDPARTGLKVVAVAADGNNPGSVCGYIDEVIVSVPYHEDEFGNDLSGKVLFQLSPVNSGKEFSAIDTLAEVCLANPENDIVWAGDSYCIVDVADLAALSSEWLECDWSDATLCDPAADVE